MLGVDADHHIAGDDRIGVVEAHARLVVAAGFVRVAVHRYQNYDNDQLKRRRHQPITMQGHWLAAVVRGHLAYYAVPGNIDAVAAFRTQATRHWHKALRRADDAH